MSRRLGGRRALVRVALAACAVAALVTAELLSGGHRASARRPAPELPAQVLSGPRIALAALRGKPAVIDFWASWCGPCRREAPALERFQASLGGRARLVGVDWTDNPGGARSFIRQYGWSFPILADAGGAVGNAYGLVGLPTSFVLDGRGRIADVLRGPQTVQSLQRAVAASAVR